MKKLNLFILKLCCLLFFVNCSQEDVEDRVEKNHMDTSAFRLPNLEKYFRVHNEIMDEIFERKVVYKNDESYISDIITLLEYKLQVVYTTEQKKFLHKAFIEYVKLDTYQMINKFVEDDMMSKEAAFTFKQIEYGMKNLRRYEEINTAIDSNKNLVNNSVVLSDFDKHQLISFLNIINNSAEHYRAIYDFTDMKELESRNCGRCIRNNLWQILLADGVGGAVLGVTGCLVFPPACVALIPALITIGSGGALALRCGGHC